MQRAIGISVHTGWAACVVVSGSLAQPEIVANELIDILDDSKRFCFHMAEGMQLEAAEKWIASARSEAITNATRALQPLLQKNVRACAIVAKSGDVGSLDGILASHPRIHTAEGLFYRDVLLKACPLPSKIVAPASLDVSRVGKLTRPPWGRDQKLAALAAWSVIGKG